MAIEHSGHTQVKKITDGYWIVWTDGYMATINDGVVRLRIATDNLETSGLSKEIGGTEKPAMETTMPRDFLATLLGVVAMARSSDR